jgi:hypothetical protein
VVTYLLMVSVKWIKHKNTFLYAIKQEFSEFIFPQFHSVLCSIHFSTLHVYVIFRYAFMREGSQRFASTHQRSAKYCMKALLSFSQVTVSLMDSLVEYKLYILVYYILI